MWQTGFNSFVGVLWVGLFRFFSGEKNLVALPGLMSSIPRKLLWFLSIM